MVSQDRAVYPRWSIPQGKHPGARGLAVANAIPHFRPVPLTPEEVEHWIFQRKWDRKYFQSPVPESEQSDAVWRDKINGAALLHDLFSELSQQRVSYDKVEHGMLLTEWFCKNDFEPLTEVAALIRQAIQHETVEPQN